MRLAITLAAVLMSGCARLHARACRTPMLVAYVAGMEEGLKKGNLACVERYVP